MLFYPDRQIESLASLDKHPGAPAGTAVHQAGQDETAQAWQSELGENVELSRHRLDEQHEALHKQSSFRRDHNVRDDQFMFLASSGIWGKESAYGPFVTSDPVHGNSEKNGRPGLGMGNQAPDLVH